MVQIFSLSLITSALFEIITKHTSIIPEVSKRDMKSIVLFVTGNRSINCLDDFEKRQTCEK